MKSEASTVMNYLDSLDESRKATVMKLRKTVLDNLPEGFEETMNYGMIGYVVPHSLYPAGYHCDTKQPLPFINIASQKNTVNFYHMGIYAKPELLNWFTKEYASQYKGKLDMGKSCMRFKKEEQIPFELLGLLVSKMSVNDWIATYESAFKR